MAAPAEAPKNPPVPTPSGPGKRGAEWWLIGLSAVLALVGLLVTYALAG